MRYRRNADDQLRQTERLYLEDASVENFRRYMRARARAGLPPIEANSLTMRSILDTELKPHYWILSVTDLQFSAYNAKIDVTRSPKARPRPRTKEEYDQAYNFLLSKIPLIIEAGWVALVQQCHFATLRIVRNREYDEYCVEWREDGHKIDAKSYYTDDRDDARQTMDHMQTQLHPGEFPELYVVPRSVLQPSGRINLDPRIGILLADQWRKGSDPRTLTQPEFRRGSYPRAVILVQVNDINPPLNYVTWNWNVPYDEGRAPSRDHGHYEMTFDNARIDYLVRLLGLEDKCHYQLFEVWHQPERAPS